MPVPTMADATSTAGVDAPLLSAAPGAAAAGPASSLPPSSFAAQAAQLSRGSMPGSPPPRRVTVAQRLARCMRAYVRPLLVFGLLLLFLLALRLTRWDYLTWRAWVALVVTCGTLVALGAEVTQPPAVFLGAMAVVVVCTVLDLKDALSGFATPLVFAIGGMYAFSRGISESTLLGCVTRCPYSVAADARRDTLAHV